MTAKIKESLLAIRVGDIVMSGHFANGYLSEKHSEVIVVDGCSSEHYVTHIVTCEEGIKHFEKTGVILPATVIINLIRFDVTRGHAQFMVEATGFVLDGTPCEFRYRRFVEARRLDKTDEIICFYLAGRSDIPIDVKDIHIIRRG